MKSLEYDSGENSFVKVGDPAPDFALDSIKGEKWRLSEQLGKVTALLFYPKNETLVCTKQMCSIRDNWSEYLKTKAEVVGISPGIIEDHRYFSQRHQLPLTLLADTEREVTWRYGWHWILPVQLTRAIVVIDANGIIRYRKVMLRAFRPTDKSVLKSIYAARTDALHNRFDIILKESKERIKSGQ